MLKNFVNEHQNDWDDYLPFLLLAYRSTIHDSTGCMPNLLFLSRELSLPIDFMAGNPQKVKTMLVRWSMLNGYTTAWRNASNLCKTLFKRLPQGKRSIMTEVLNLVLMRLGILFGGVIPQNFGIALIGDWIGPYKVTAKFSSVTYEVQRTPRSKPFSVHVDHVKPYEGEQPPSEWMDALVVAADDSAYMMTLPICSLMTLLISHPRPKC